jgi:hypothetical protein
MYRIITFYSNAVVYLVALLRGYLKQIYFTSRKREKALEEKEQRLEICESRQCGSKLFPNGNMFFSSQRLSLGLVLVNQWS